MPPSEPTTNSPEDLGWTPAATGREPLRFPIPPSSPLKACRSCEADIHWIVTAQSRRMPVNPDGTSHFASCPNANEHRKPKAPATPKPTPLTAEQFFMLRGISQGRQPQRRWPSLFAADELLRAKLIGKNDADGKYFVTQPGTEALARDARSK